MTKTIHKSLAKCINSLSNVDTAIFRVSLCYLDSRSYSPIVLDSRTTGLPNEKKMKKKGLNHK